MAKEFEGQFECLGENIEKYITFSVLVKTKLENDKRITYKTKFIDGFRFMSSSLSSLVDNLFGGLRNSKCKSCLDNFIEDNQLIFNFPKYNKNHKKILMQTWLKDLQTHTNSVMETLINLFCCLEKEFVHTNTLITGKDLMKRHYLIKKIFTVI